MSSKLDRVKAFLQDIVNGNLDNVRKLRGICGNLHQYFDVTIHPLCFEGWPGHSGDKCFPIPGGEERYLNGEVAFWRNGGELLFWSGDQLKDRQNLCQYLLDGINNGEIFLREDGVLCRKINTKGH